jgi:hypothetical protein
VLGPPDVCCVAVLVSDDGWHSPAWVGPAMGDDEVERQEQAARNRVRASASRDGIEKTAAAPTSKYWPTGCDPDR